MSEHYQRSERLHSAYLFLPPAQRDQLLRAQKFFLTYFMEVNVRVDTALRQRKAFRQCPFCYLDVYEPAVCADSL